MDNKFTYYLLGFTIILGSTISFDRSLLVSPVLAQSSERSTSLEIMNLEVLERILQDNIDNIEGQSGQWRFKLNEISLIVLADVRANRMRIVAPIINTEELNSEQIQKVLLANFHTALDARYAIADGFLTATFLHPLDSLQERDLLSALNQTASLATTFGTTYSSGELLFIPGGREQQTSPPENSVSL